MLNRWRRVAAEYRFAWCALALFVASDFKFRTRSIDSSISAKIDFFVLLELGLYGIVGLWLVTTFVRRPPRHLRAPLPQVLLGTWLFMLAVSISYTPYASFGGVRVGEMCVTFLLSCCIGAYATRADLHRIAHAFVLLVAGATIYGVVRPSPPVTAQQVGRFTWLAVHPTVSGVFLGVATVLAFTYLVVRARREGPTWSPWVYGVLLVIVGGGLLATKTRASVLAAAAGIAVCVWIAAGRKHRLEVSIGMVLVGSLGYLLAMDQVVAYFARGESTEQLATFNSRTVLWTAALEAVLKKPLFGWGVGASQGIFQEATGLGGGHNAAINVLVDLGVVGLLVWAVMLLSLTAGLLVVARRGPGLALDRVLVLSIIAVIAVNGFFYAGPGGVANVGATWVYLLIAWYVALLRHSRTTDSTRVVGGAWVVPAPRIVAPAGADAGASSSAEAGVVPAPRAPRG